VAKSEQPSAPPQAAQRTLVHIQSEISSYSGPLPHPDILAKYEQLDPGRAARILDWIESQSNHRMQLENQVVRSDGKRPWCGLFFGFVVAIFTVGAGAYVAVQGHPTAGATIATTVVVGLVGTFIYGSESRKHERSERARTLARRQKA